MKIDKSRGEWCSSSKFIDNVAYLVYLNCLDEYNKSLYEKYNFKEKHISQEIMIMFKPENEIIRSFYIKANNIIRKEKLEKINENR